MTTKLEQAARALLAHWDTPIWKDVKPTADLMADLREALAEQAEQEPVGEVVMESMGVGDAQIVRFRMNGRIPPVGTKLYAAPVRTKDLTDDEIMKINVDTASIVPTCDRQFHFARAVIAADREKNK